MRFTPSSSAWLNRLRVGRSSLTAAFLIAFIAVLAPPASASPERTPPVTGCRNVAPTGQITGAIRAAYQKGRGIPAGDADFLILVRCDGHRWFALAYVDWPEWMGAVFLQDPEATVDGVQGYMYQDGPDRFAGRGPASWVHLGDTGGYVSCGRERGEFPRQVARIAGVRCERSIPQLIPLIPDTWESCATDSWGMREIVTLGLHCERATDIARALYAHGGRRPKGVISAGHRRWHCATTGPLASDSGMDQGQPTWYVARCDWGRHHVAFGTRA